MRVNELQIPRFESERLLCIPVLEAHAAWTEPILRDAALYTWMPRDPPTLEALKRRYSYWERRASPDGSELWWNWTLIRKGADPETPGACVGTLQAGIDVAHLGATLAYIVGRDAQGQGYGTEAVNALIATLRGLGVREVKAWVDTRNRPSIALLERVGLRRIEKIEGADFFKGASSDEWVYALELASDAGEGHS